MTQHKPRIAFIGGGNMASAIIGGMTGNGFAAANIRVADPYPPSLEKLQQQFGVDTCTDNNEVIRAADVIILAVKPQQMQQVCIGIRASLDQHQPLIISIAAGISCRALQAWLGEHLAIVRCMPNTPALVQQAASGLFANAQVSTAQKQLAEDLLAAIGTVDWVAEEALLDAVTALSGSGPAYFFLVMEAMIDAGIALGLAPEVARSLTLQTALGAASMALASDVDVAELRRRVTSPGGTTEAAIASFEAGHIRQLFGQALEAASQRSQTLGQQLE